MRKLASEVVGTYILIFAGCGSVVVNDITDGTVTLVGIGLVWGLLVLALVYALGDVSGAHINPAVTLGFVLAGRFPLSWAGPYIVAQCIGSTLAALSLHALFPYSLSRAGTTLPAGPVMQTFWLEVFLTGFLMLVVLQVSTGAKEKGMLAGVAVGGVIALEVMFAGPISGASMNPARSLGPALVSWRLEHLWVYLVAPVVGAALAVPLWRLFREP